MNKHLILGSLLVITVFATLVGIMNLIFWDSISVMLVVIALQSYFAGFYSTYFFKDKL